MARLSFVFVPASYGTPLRPVTLRPPCFVPLPPCRFLLVLGVRGRRHVHRRATVHLLVLFEEFGEHGPTREKRCVRETGTPPPRTERVICLGEPGPRKIGKGEALGGAGNADQG